MSDADDPCNSSSNALIEEAPQWPSTKGRFNPEAFIADVKEHPVIWDLNLDEYKVRGMRALAWDTICHKYIVNYAEKSVKEKRAAAAMLQRKWKSYRDSFTREIARQKRSKAENHPADSFRKRYGRFQDLSFLTDAIDTRCICPADKPKLQGTSDPRILSGYPIPEKHSTKKEKKSNIFIEAADEILLNNSQNLTESQNHEEGDPDRNFVLSLIPHLKQIPEEYKLDVQSEILMTIKKYKPYGRQMYNQPYVYCTPSYSLPHQPISTSLITQSTPPAQPPVAPPSSPAAVSKNAPSPVISKGALGFTDDDDPVIDNIV